MVIDIGTETERGAVLTIKHGVKLPVIRTGLNQFLSNLQGTGFRITAETIGIRDKPKIEKIRAAGRDSSIAKKKASR